MSITITKFFFRLEGIAQSFKNRLSQNLLGVSLGLFFLFSCEQYQIQRHVPFAKMETVSVPFVEGDRNGEFTNVLIQHLLTQTGLHYQKEGGELLLKVKFLETRREDTGYRYERDSDNNLENKLIPNEGRITRDVEVVLETADTHTPIVGPLVLTVSVNYDFEFDPVRSNIHTLSLGQIDTIQNANGLADNALFNEMAQRIVESINHAW